MKGEYAAAINYSNGCWSAANREQVLPPSGSIRSSQLHGTHLIIMSKRPTR